MIETNKSVEFENLLSLRKKINQNDINHEMIKIDELMKSKGVTKKGPVISTTYSVENLSDGLWFDMEILVPIDKMIEVKDEYKVKQRFRLTNALHLRYEGNPNLIQSAYDEMINYIREHELVQITSGYNVTENSVDPMTLENRLVIDVYIGVSPNII